MAETNQSELSEIQAAMAERDFTGALEALDGLLAQSPEHGDVLYFKAVCLRYMGEYEQAGLVLEELLGRFPENGRCHQELAHWYRDQGHLERALPAYSRACQLNPALAASYKGQLQILRKLGWSEVASKVYKQLQQLERLPEPLIGVTDLLYQGKLLRAEDLCRSFLDRYPHHVEAMRLLAEIGVRLGIMDDAEFLLESAIEFEPENVAVRMDYVQVLRKRQRFEKALSEARHLLKLDPANPQYQSIYAVVSMQTGDYAEALRIFDRILQSVPKDPATHTSKGHALKTIGDFDAAVDAYRQAYIHKSDHGEAFYSLSNLKTYRFTEQELARMHELEQSERMAAMDRIYLYFALGKAYEDAADYARAYDYYESGNRLKKAESRYEADQMSADLATQKNVCTQALFESKQGMGCEVADPIFIVGLPRAGSTLLEQILSSHSQVDGTLELPNVLSLSHRLRRSGRQSEERRGYPDVLEDLTAEELRDFGEQYIRDTRIHRQGAPFFTDKMPNNFRHIGLIKLILPNARIIDARRDAMGCCFSGFKQLFAEGQEFTYSQQDIGRYYCDYVEIMQHWDDVLPGFVLRVQHEDVVDDLEGQVRRILAFCGLPFEDACLHYYETERSVRTPSSEQVRQPIFRDSLVQWRNYEPYLAPLKEALGPHARLS